MNDGDEVFFCKLGWSWPGVQRGILGSVIEDGRVIVAGGQKFWAPMNQIAPASGITHLVECDTCGVWCFPAQHGNGHLYLEVAPHHGGEWAIAPETDPGEYVAVVVPTAYGAPGSPTYRRHVCTDRFGPLSQSPVAR